MRLRPPDPDETVERGAIAVLTALLTVVVLAVAALGVDIATQVNERQKLHDTIDAAALAGAYQLPSNGPQAKQDALDFAAKNDPTGPPPDVVTLCVVGSIFNASSGLYEVDTSQISATCNRSAGTSTTGAKCNASICSLPCVAADRCNVIKVVGIKPVPFSFAPAIGISQGSTGSVTSAACKGPCGKAPLNPMDVVVVADRTQSMDPSEVTAMITGIKGMLEVMTPSQQYVALGTIHRSAKTGHSTAACDSTNKGLSWPSTSTTTGHLVPVEFSKNYLTGAIVNTADALVKGVNCLSNRSSGSGTHLASPMKAAARYLLGKDPNNLPSPETRMGTIRKAIIFETDGAPNESIQTGGSTDLDVVGDVSSTASNDSACTNLKTVAANAKTAGILVITVGFNLKDSNNGSLPARCSSGGARVVDTLAAAASLTPSGDPSVADNTCLTPTERTAENADLDYFFCAAPNDVLAPIFVTAFGQLANGSRLIQLPE